MGMAKLWCGKENRPSLAAPMSQERTALIFDLDGTLIDSVPDLHRSLNAVLAEQGRAPVSLADMRAMVGDGAAKLIERGFADTGAPCEPAALPGLVERFLVHYGSGRYPMTTAFPGVVETLAALKARGCRLGVCTNKPYRPSLEILEVLGLAPFFDAVTGGDSLPVRKPDPGHLLGTLALLGASADAAVMVGDSANDVAVARAAGVPCVIVSYGYTLVPAAELGGDGLIDEFADVLSWLDAQAGGGAG
jgi:phosphoglycolate phosphatase